MKHSYSNDDTCFSIDVIGEILEEDFNALLDEGSKILHSIEGTILEEKLFAKFDKFMAMTADENSKSESDTKEPPFKKITFNTDYKIKTSIEEPHTELELKPLFENQEYVFLEEPSFLPVIISSQLSEENKNKLVSEAGLEVDKAKIDVISKLPPPTNIKGIRSFLGHAGFYRRFIKDFSKIARPLTKLLEKDTPFEFNDECQNAFKILKEKLTCAPVIVSPNWSLPFELMCDASDFAVGAILGQKEGRNFHPIYFASKTLNAAQQNYTITEKELMAVVFAFDKFRSYLIMEKTMKRYGVNHRSSTSYHPQTSGQVENPNRALKRILEKTVKDNLAIWSRKLDDALWAFCIAYKTPTETTPNKLTYGKNCHLPFEIEHRAYWALKNCNPDLITAGEKWMCQLHELDELRHQAYEKLSSIQGKNHVLAAEN
ncbi:reverse transcriptase domain-containing protein [Tanacetum coccineum]